MAECAEVAYRTRTSETELLRPQISAGSGPSKRPLSLTLTRTVVGVPFNIVASWKAAESRRLEESIRVHFCWKSTSTAGLLLTMKSRMKRWPSSSMYFEGKGKKVSSQCKKYSVTC